MFLKSFVINCLIFAGINSAWASDLVDEAKLKITYKSTVYSLKGNSLEDSQGNKLRASPIKVQGKNTTFGAEVDVIIPAFPNKTLSELVLDPRNNLQAVYSTGERLNLYKIF